MYSLTLDIGGTNPRIAIVNTDEDISHIKHINPDTDIISQINDYLKDIA